MSLRGAKAALSLRAVAACVYGFGTVIAWSFTFWPFAAIGVVFVAVQLGRRAAHIFGATVVGAAMAFMVVGLLAASEDLCVPTTSSVPLTCADGPRGSSVNFLVGGAALALIGLGVAWLLSRRGGVHRQGANPPRCPADV